MFCAVLDLDSSDLTITSYPAEGIILSCIELLGMFIKEKHIPDPSIFS